MALDRMFQTMESLRELTSVKAAFGEPREVEGRVLIPVARVSIGFGMGFGSEEKEKPTEGGGAGGGGGASPVAMIEVTPETTVVRPILDETKIALAGVALIGWCVFWLMITVWAILGRKEE